MSKIHTAIFTTLVIIITVACIYIDSAVDKIIFSLPDYENCEKYQSTSFQDYTDYIKYTYNSVSEKDLSETDYFKKVTTADIETILLYVEDFERWLPEEWAENYDFDKTIISCDDFFYIKIKEYETDEDKEYFKFHNYKLYYFDIDAQILYYFANKI